MQRQHLGVQERLVVVTFEFGKAIIQINTEEQCVGKRYTWPVSSQYAQGPVHSRREPGPRDWTTVGHLSKPGVGAVLLLADEPGRL